MLVVTGTRKPRAPALLSCENPKGSCGQWTRHTFDSTRLVAEDGTEEELYRCNKCGTLRRWGLLSSEGKPRSRGKDKPGDAE